MKELAETRCDLLFTAGVPVAWAVSCGGPCSFTFCLSLATAIETAHGIGWWEQPWTKLKRIQVQRYCCGSLRFWCHYCVAVCCLSKLDDQLAKDAIAVAVMCDPQNKKKAQSNLVVSCSFFYLLQDP